MFRLEKGKIFFWIKIVTLKTIICIKKIKSTLMVEHLKR